MARALRDMGDGFLAVLLPAYLLGLSFSPLQVRVIATASLLGSALLTIGVGIAGVRSDHRRLLFAAASLMVATGVAFALFHDYALLLVIAFAGTVNPSAGSVSVFVPLEHAVLAREVADAERTRMFAHYSLLGALAGAVGALASATPDPLVPLGLDQWSAIKAMFVLYAFLGLLGGFLYARIQRRRPTADSTTGSALGPSRKIVFKLAALFSMTPLPEASSSSRCSPCGCSRSSVCRSPRQASSFLVGGPVGILVPRCRLAVAAHRAHRHDGVHAHPVQHRPDAGGARANTASRTRLAADPRRASQMNVPTRSSYVMAVVTEAERAAAASVTSVPRSGAAIGLPIWAAG